MVDTTIITLPNGKEATVSTVALSWWDQQDGFGHVDPRQLTPDPDQPRKKMNASQLTELYASIKEKGVVEPITVTPLHRAPWARAEEGHEYAYFLIVSGHRRTNGANLAAIHAVPIRVVIYDCEADHREDAALLNGIREDLDELEQGYEFVRLQRLGRTISTIAKRFGMSETHVHNRVYLTRLPPDVQQLLYKQGSRRPIPIVVGSKLGSVKVPTVLELDALSVALEDTVPFREVVEECDLEKLDAEGRLFTMHRLIAQYIVRKKMRQIPAIKLIEKHTANFESHANRRGPKPKEPRKQRSILKHLCQGVIGSDIQDWTPSEVRAMFEPCSVTEIQQAVEQIQKAEDVLSAVRRLVSSALEQKKEASEAKIVTLVRTAS